MLQHLVQFVSYRVPCVAIHLILEACSWRHHCRLWRYVVHEYSHDYGWHVGCGVDCHLHVVRPTYHSLHVQSSVRLSLFAAIGNSILTQARAVGCCCTGFRKLRCVFNAKMRCQYFNWYHQIMQVYTRRPRY